MLGSSASPADKPMPLRGTRLLLRTWRDDDLAAFAALNADPRVMRFLAKTLTPSESDELAKSIRGHFAEHGFGRWAVEIPGKAPFIGFIGCAFTRFDAHFTPCVEIGWRLAYDYWKKGYAIEGARAAADHAFGQLGLAEIVAFTAPANAASRRVMTRLGMTHDAEDDFDHPALPDEHPLRRHVLYRLQKGAVARRATDGV